MRLRTARITLTLLLLITAVAGLGFAHQTAATPDRGLAAYVAAGGALADICGDRPEHAALPDCEACRIGGDAGLALRASGCAFSHDLAAAERQVLQGIPPENPETTHANAPRAPPVSTSL